MAESNPMLPGINIITVDPVSGLIFQAVSESLDALPNGTSYAGLFEPHASLIVAGGTAAGNYTNAGTTASPNFV